MQKMFCSAPKMQLHLPKAASALRKAAGTRPLWRTLERRTTSTICFKLLGRLRELMAVPKEDFSSQFRDWRFRSCSDVTTGLAKHHRNVFAFLWTVPRKWLPCPIQVAFQCALGSAGPLRPAALSPAVLEHVGFAGDPVFPALADQAHSASEVVSDSLQGGETEEFCRRPKSEFDLGFTVCFPSIIRLTESTAFPFSSSQRHCFLHWLISSSPGHLHEYQHCTWRPKGFFMLIN